ncbi:MAG: quaternary amine ABC transporter ATP-binding protein [Alphaproteobacteria bacterium]|jgi:glycine betaine/proline transport system ATP-binding protein
MPNIGISIKNLYKVFGSNPNAAMELLRKGMGKGELLEKTGHILAVNDICLEIEQNKIQVVMGLSGSGKSTLIRLINRLIEPSAGKILLDGEDVRSMSAVALRKTRRNKISMVFQSFALFPHRTVIENVGYGLKVQGDSRNNIKKSAKRWIDRVGLSGYENYYPTQLSGGMQQRVGLARALTTDADILLMDEAFSALDPLIKAVMQDILLDLQEEIKKTIVFITHDLDEALHLGDKIAILRDGMVVQNDNPQNILLNPANAYVSDFMKDINRARILLVGSIMEALDSNLEGPTMPESTTLEEALQEFVNFPNDHAIIVNQDRQKIGMLTIGNLIRSMHRPDSKQNKASIKEEKLY